MTKREIVKQTLDHKSCGHVPYSVVLTLANYDLYADRLLADYPNPQVMRDLEDGLLTKPQAVSLAIGNHLLYVYAPWWDFYDPDREFAKEVQDPPEYLPNSRGRGSYEFFFKQMQILRDHYDVWMNVTIFGSCWEKANTLRSIENFCADLAGNTEWAQALLDKIYRKNLNMLDDFLTAPEIDSVLLGSDWGSQRGLMISPQRFREMIKPGEKAEYDLIHQYGKKVFVHSCGNILQIMDDLCEIGVDCLNPVQPECMDLKTIKDSWGSKMSFYGGISTQKTLPLGTPAEVAAETRATIELMSKNGGYITASSQEVQPDVSYENLIALIETAKEFA
ncbi:hypothetical protein FACS1894219_12530 [Clostridia bacterium]|nr:hypothetical protein FACS1894219_12530 [Clostridia bacterium]